MAAFSSLQSGDDPRLATSVDTAIDAPVLPRSWPVHSVDTLDMFAHADADKQRTPPVVLQIPDLEALEARNVEPSSWMHSPVVLKSAGMVGSVIVTIIVAAIAASFKTHAPPATVGKAPTWQQAAPASPTPRPVYDPPVADGYRPAVAPGETPGNSYQTAPSQSANSRDYQAAPEIHPNREVVPAQDPRELTGGNADAAQSADAAQAGRGALPEWPNFNPPREESTGGAGGDAIRGVYRNPFVESDDQSGAADSRAELRTADIRAGVGDAMRRDEVRRDESDAAPVARLNGTIIKSNSDRSYGNTGSSLH